MFSSVYTRLASKYLTRANFFYIYFEKKPKIIILYQYINYFILLFSFIFNVYMQLCRVWQTWKLFYIQRKTQSDFIFFIYIFLHYLVIFIIQLLRHFSFLYFIPTNIINLLKTFLLPNNLYVLIQVFIFLFFLLYLS